LDTNAPFCRLDADGLDAPTLIGFGFTIVQFFDRLETISSAKPALAPRLPRYLGLALIFSVIITLTKVAQHV
jgi:hypothetical protein